MVAGIPILPFFIPRILVFAIPIDWQGHGGFMYTSHFEIRAIQRNLNVRGAIQSSWRFHCKKV
jgi:hypothetical protein